MMAMVTGICFFAMRLSKTTGTRKSPLTLANPPPSWKTITAAGLLPSYCAGT